MLARSLGGLTLWQSPLCRNRNFALKVRQLPYELGITQIIDKRLLCVKHYYHTTFGVPKKLSHSGSAHIQTLNSDAFEDIFAFISDRSTRKMRLDTERWSILPGGMTPGSRWPGQQICLLSRNNQAPSRFRRGFNSGDESIRLLTITYQKYRVGRSTDFGDGLGLL